MKLLSSPHSKIKSERRKLENDEFSHFKENVSTVLLLSTRFITLRILITNHCDRMWQREEDQFQMSQNESKEVDLTVKLKRVQFNKKLLELELMIALHCCHTSGQQRQLQRKALMRASFVTAQTIK